MEIESFFLLLSVLLDMPIHLRSRVDRASIHFNNVLIRFYLMAVLHQVLHFGVHAEGTRYFLLRRALLLASARCWIEVLILSGDDSGAV